MSEWGAETPSYPSRRFPHYFCDVCRLTSRAARLHCNACDYDLCGACTARAAAVRCRRGHAMAVVEWGAEIPSYPSRRFGLYNCAVCRTEGLRVARMHCNACDYDICGACTAAALARAVVPAAPGTCALLLLCLICVCACVRMRACACGFSGV